MYKGFIKDVMNARDTASLHIVEPPGRFLDGCDECSLRLHDMILDIVVFFDVAD